ncbi:MAG: TetR family transcriptional regulator [Amycolatopsis sp.]|jgi:TetR/AcrR family transcriptional repressor of nem operon|uniref:TetR/AcrR family transcriptional regulator n=1 Tax=Amycolatopsis sp. TaxID=37632 RepID=UPI00262C735D|nr:TetR/AcrR family transcriptional regulator [Amycolatopsis sp.]MCU1683657.1 TetR family transcriptional regulator [Amycolatopsis sp.]
MATQAVTDQGKRTRDSILGTASQLIYANGVAATSLDKILAACGAGKSQMYHYFKNKQQMVEAVIEYDLERILANQPLIGELRTWENFDQWVEDLLDLHRGPGGPSACPLGNLTGELGSDSTYAPLIDKAYRTWESYLARGLTLLQDKGELAADADPGRLAQATMACLQGGLLLSHIRRDIIPLSDALHIALESLKRHRVGG